MQEENSELSLCPSFNSYSSDKLADIAAKVTSEYFAGEDHHRHERQQQQQIDGKHEDSDDDFEFVSLSRSEEVVFFDGRTGRGPVFPVFNRDLLRSPQRVDDDHRDGNPTAEKNDVRSMRVPLMKLFVQEEERDLLPSSSSSEADELEGLPTGTYCVWAPNNNNSVKSSPSRCKKSSSTGSLSKRWRLLNLLKRSNSDGKDAFVFLTPSNSKKEEIINKAEVPNKPKVSNKPEKVKFKGETVSSAHQAFYAKNKTDKRRTYLPYRQDLVGFWTNMPALGRSFPSF